MSISIDIGTAEVKLIQLGKVNGNAVVDKIYSKSTWDDLNTFDPDKLQKTNWVGTIKSICDEIKIIPKKVKPLIASISGKNISIKEVITLDMREEELFQTLEFEAKKHIPEVQASIVTHQRGVDETRCEEIASKDFGVKYRARRYNIVG